MQWACSQADECNNPTGFYTLQVVGLFTLNLSLFLGGVKMSSWYEGIKTNCAGFLLKLSSHVAFIQSSKAKEHHMWSMLGLHGAILHHSCNVEITKCVLEWCHSVQVVGKKPQPGFLTHHFYHDSQKRIWDVQKSIAIYRRLIHILDYEGKQRHPCLVEK